MAGLQHAFDLSGWGLLTYNRNCVVFFSDDWYMKFDLCYFYGSYASHRKYSLEDWDIILKAAKVLTEEGMEMPLIAWLETF